MKNKVWCLLLLLTMSVMPMMASAQWSRAHRDADTNRFHCNLSLGTGVTSGWGSTHAYTLVAPSFEYRLSPKVTAFGGFVLCDDVNLSTPRPSRTQSYAMKPNSNRAASMAAGALFQPNDRLTLAACVYYLGGQVDPLWSGGYPMRLDAFGVSGAMNYRFKNNSSISLFFDYVHDNAGTLVDPWMMHFGDPFFHDGWHTHLSPLNAFVPNYYLW